MTISGNPKLPAAAINSIRSDILSKYFRPEVITQQRLQQDDFVISKIGVRNIKSLEDVQLPIRNLNVVLGSNSAGKSTMLQCLALLAQSSTNFGRADLSLNGSLVKFGSFEEFRRRGSSKDPEIEIVIAGGQRTGPVSQYSKVTPLHVRASFTLAQVGPNRGIANIRAAKIQIGAEGYETSFEWQSLSINPDVDWNFRVVECSNGDLGVFDDTKSPIDIFPSSFLSYQTYSQWLVSSLRWHQARVKPGKTSKKGVNNQTFQKNISEIILLHSKVLAESVGEPNASRSIQKDVEFGRAMSFVEYSKIDYLANYINKASQEDLVEIVDTLVLKSPLMERPLLLPKLGANFTGEYLLPSIAASKILDLFRAKFNYLGPLRLEPTASQKIDLEPSPSAPVGAKGEYFGYQLSYGKSSQRQKQYPRPKGMAAKSQKLSDAVQEWMKWMDLGEQLETKEEGRDGLQTRTDKEAMYQKGTGLSQILPVLVLGLVAEPGTMTVIEQPELHLHPAVQQKLGDFFLQLSKSGRRFMIESHSEYMVTRLRKLVYVDGEKSSDVAIVFATQIDNKAGTKRKTVLELAEITESGDLTSWPKGFFDFANDDEAQIIMKRFKD